MIYKREEYVKASECDARSRLGITPIVEIIEDAVTELLREQELDGLSIKRKFKAVWVVVRNNIRIFRYPDWLERFTVESFISARTPATVNFDTLLYDTSGGVILKSRVEMCAIDVENGRIRRTSSVGVTDEVETHTPLEDLEFDRFERKDADRTGSAFVMPTNIDYIGHTNNVEYVRLLMNTYPGKFQYSNDIKRIQANYLSMSYEGDELGVYRKSEGKTDLVLFKRGEKDVFGCMIEWK